MKTFYIKHGMGGGYGGIELNDWEKIEAVNLDDAWNQAWGLACEEYQGSQEAERAYEDAYETGIEEGMTEEEAQDFAGEAEREDMESWIEYCAQEEKPEDYEDE